MISKTIHNLFSPNYQICINWVCQLRKWQPQTPDGRWMPTPYDCYNFGFNYIYYDNLLTDRILTYSWSDPFGKKTRLEYVDPMYGLITRLSVSEKNITIWTESWAMISIQLTSRTRGNCIKHCKENQFVEPKRHILVPCCTEIAHFRPWVYQSIAIFTDTLLIHFCLSPG